MGASYEDDIALLADDIRRYSNNDGRIDEALTQCAFPDCDRERRYRSGYCGTHEWQRKANRGLRPIKPQPRGTLEERFWYKVQRGAPDECWRWAGGLGRAGYGQIYDGNKPMKMLLAHRVSYELNVGPIPDGLQLDHLCRNRACVNPAHLEPVTLAENLRRGYSPSALNARKTHCKRGHEFTPENTYQWPGRGGRACRECARLSQQTQTENRREAQRRRRQRQREAS